MIAIGPSGCGNTTLQNLFAGFLRPTGGEVRFAGTPVRVLHVASYCRTMRCCHGWMRAATWPWSGCRTRAAGASGSCPETSSSA